MRSDDEDNDYDEEEEDEDDEEMNNKEDYGNDLFEDADDQDADEGAGDADADEDEDEEDEDEDAEDDDEDGDDQDDDDDEDDDDEDEDDEDGEGNDEEEDTKEDEAMEPSAATQASEASAPSKSPTKLPTPPHLIRRQLFQTYIPPDASLSVEAMVGIPLPSATHCIATSSCLSYLLTGSQDGYIRAYDFWSSVNGGQTMTAQQRAVVGLGEGVSKAGVGRGWWSNDVETTDSTGTSQRKTEPIYSLTCEADALWALAGSQSGPINLYSLRHQPGHLIHSLQGHTSVVSCMQLLSDEQGLISGSWDGSIRQWDLNTGQVVRTYPSHGAQISSVAMRPLTPQTSTEAWVENGDGPKISVHVGADFFDKPSNADGEAAGETIPPSGTGADGDVTMADSEADADGEGDGDAKSATSYDPLFDDDDDAEGEDESKAGDIIMADGATGTNTPASAPPSRPSLALPGTQAAPSLALPGQPKPPAKAEPSKPEPLANGSSAATPHFAQPSAAASSSRQAAASNIPILSPTDYRGFSNDVLLSSSMDGQVVLIDRRAPNPGAESGVAAGVGRLMPGERAPPWCMSATWLGDGNQVLAGRRNGTVDIWDVRKASATAPSLLRTLRTPANSGPISSIVAFPDGQHVAIASQDNIRLWNTVEYYEPEKEKEKKRSGKPPFRIIAGHHGGIISSMVVDPTCRFLITASGDRGWQGESTRVVLVHEIKW